MERTQIVSWTFLCFSAALVAVLACTPSGSEHKENQVNKQGTACTPTQTAELLTLDLMGSYKTPCCRDVFVSDSYAYVVDNSFRNECVHIIDVSNPEKPSLVSSYGAFPEPPCRVFVESSYAYVADRMAGLHIIDVSDPKNPKLVSTYLTGQPVINVFVKGSLAYLEDCEGHGLEIVDISEPRMPRQVSCYKTGSILNTLSVSGGYAYLAGFIPPALFDIRPAAMGVLIVDISESANPKLAGFAVTGDPLHTCAEGDYLYVVDAASSLIVLDISNPAKPRPVTTCKLPGMANDLLIRGHYLFVAWGKILDCGLQVINISNPENPVVVCNYYAPIGNVTSVFVVKSYVYMTHDRDGLLILKLSQSEVRQ